VRTTVDVALRGMDRMVRDFAALEDESRRYAEVENVPVTTYAGAEHASEAVTRLLRTEPQVVVVRDLINADMVRVLAKHAESERLVLATIRARDAVEALVLPQLGRPAGRIAAFYHPPETAEQPCPACGGTGYLGRTAIFELLVPDDGFRRALAAGARLDALRAAARRTGMPGLQEEGILLVAKGVTSVNELIRVLK